jgi:HSP90 family molecular chaperone
MMSVREQCLKLSKAELVELINDRSFWWHITEADILQAKINVLHKKREEAWAMYLEMGPIKTDGSFESTMSLITAISAREDIYRKYEKYQQRIDRYYTQIKKLRNT